MLVGNWSQVDPGDVVALSIDYTDRLAPSETILSVAWTATVLAGTDPSPQGRVSGASNIQGPLVTQLFSFVAMPPGNRYRLNCAAQTSLGQTINAYGHVSVSQPS